MDALASRGLIMEQAYTTATTYKMTYAVPENQRMWWKVWAFDGSGEPGPFSQAWFMYRDLGAPAALKAVANGLNYDCSFRPVAGAEDYEFELFHKTKTGTSVLLDAAPAAGGHRQAFSAAIPKYGDRYYWRVRAANASHRSLRKRARSRSTNRRTASRKRSPTWRRSSVPGVAPWSRAS